MTKVEVFAPAKVNLTLHITGQTDDGYHLLDSLVAFATVGDRLRLSPGDRSLAVEGSEAAGVPTNEDNLAMRAVDLVPEIGPQSMLLEKNLPAASGIGGGSADAGAALRAALALALEEDDSSETWEDRIQTLGDQILGLGADVPMCLLCRPVRAGGIGEDLTLLDLPKIPVLLVNPRVSIPTGPVFKALERKNNLAMPDELPKFETPEALIDFIAAQRNDLQAPAIANVPVIQEVLDLLSALDGCNLARMSGSGATCFGLFESEAAAIAAGHIIGDRQPEWWMHGGWLGDQSNAAEPQLIRATT